MHRLLPLALVPVLALAGCSGSAATPQDGRIRVVASTDVWGDVAAQIGGSAVHVDSLIDNPNHDPHEYQADARDQLAVSRAQLVVLNGGGYDDFLTQLLRNAPTSTRVVNAVRSSGLDPASPGFNEHLWYDLPVVAKVAGVVADELTTLRPAKAALFRSRSKAFATRIAALVGKEASIRATSAGRGVAITEPVPLHLTEALGLVDRTPAAFSAAVEAGNEVAPAVLRAQLALIREHRVAVLAYDAQSTGRTTELVLSAAKAAGVPAVAVRETLPPGQGYLEWMRHDLAAFAAALRR